MEPGEQRRGGQVNVAIRAPRPVHVWLSITAVPSGVAVFRPLRITSMPARRKDITLGTRFMSGGAYLVRASSAPSMRMAGIAALSILPRGIVPLAALLPALLRGAVGRRDVPRGLSEGRVLQPPAAPPVQPQEAGPPPPGTSAAAPPGGTRDRPLDWPTERAWPGRPAPTPTDPWGTGSPLTRAEVEAALERERQKRRERPWLKPLPEGTVEDVMLSLARDGANSKAVAERYDLRLPVYRYRFNTERDWRVCKRCRSLDRRAWPPWRWRPPIPVHRNCRCHYDRVFQPPTGASPF